jgi:hypothetical protein
VRFIRVGDGSREAIEVPLLDAAGRPLPEALSALSILARPRDAARPEPADVAAHAGDLEWVATGVRRLHPGLLVRLDVIARRFGARPIEIVSGYRPDARETSRHRTGSAIDLRLVGVSAEELDAFAATLPETGVGLYPASGFVHLDVRARRAHWLDLSGPGEPSVDREARPLSSVSRRPTPEGVAPAEGRAAVPPACVRALPGAAPLAHHPDLLGGPHVGSEARLARVRLGARRRPWLRRWGRATPA